MQLVANHPTSPGDYPLADVMLALDKQVQRQMDYAWKKLEEDKAKGDFPPRSYFQSNAASNAWAGPSYEAITSGISFSVFLDVLLPEGELLAKSSSGQLLRITDPEALFLELDPPIAPTAIQTSSDTISFAEFRPEVRQFSFINTTDWTIRATPYLDNCQSEFDRDEVCKHWEYASSCAGNELHFRSSVIFGQSKPISPSQISQRCRAAIETIIVGKTPRSNSPLFPGFVVEVAQELASSRASKSNRVEQRKTFRQPKPPKETIKLSWLMNLKTLGVEPSHKTNRGLRRLRDAITAFLQERR